MGKAETKYTIKEIARAWEKFTGPIWLVSNRKVIQEEVVKERMILVDDPKDVSVLEIDYSRWIPYLISEEWKLDALNSLPPRKKK